jgi:hypothetical protein
MKGNMNFDHWCSRSCEDRNYEVEYELDVQYSKNGKEYLIDYFEMKIRYAHCVEEGCFYKAEEFLSKCGVYCDDGKRFASPFKLMGEEVLFNSEDLYKYERSIELGNKLFKYAFEDFENKKMVYINGEYQFSIK